MVLRDVRNCVNLAENVIRRLTELVVSFGMSCEFNEELGFELVNHNVRALQWKF